MRDIQAVKNSVDILSLVGPDNLHKVAATAGGEYAGPCPFCGGRDRFHVQPAKGRWFCRRCGDGKWRDVIDFVRLRDGVDFKEAVRRLSGPATPAAARPKRPPATCRPDGPPPAKWQEQARQFVADCEEVLWSERGAKARAWLHKRGLEDETIRAWRLGLNTDRERTSYGVVIPWFCGPDFWMVNIRRPTGTPKYKALRGSKRGGLYGVDHFSGHADLFVTEGELDTILLQQEANLFADVVTAGFAPAGPADRWLLALLKVQRFWIVTDADQAGEEAAARWLATVGKRGRRVLPPGGAKDVSDAFVAGHDLADWAVEIMSAEV
jgi:DNA primase